MLTPEQVAPKATPITYASIAMAPAVAMAAVYASLAHSSAIAMANATTAQKNQNLLGNAATKLGIEQLQKLGKKSTTAATNKIGTK